MTGSTHVVIVNRNAGEHLERCLESVALASRDGVDLARVTVIDNASTDGSADELDGMGLPLEVIVNGSNVGFAAACNQGGAGSQADYLVFLNPDTRLLGDTLAAVTGFMDSEQAQRIGICGVQALDPAGDPGISCSRFPTLPMLTGKATGLDRVLPRLFPRHHMTAEETRHSGVVDQVIGAFFFVRRELFTRLNGFDTRYFIYYEEVDFALRARQLGFLSYFLREARIVHEGSVSAAQERDVRLYHSLRSRMIFTRRHWPRWQAVLLEAVTFGVELPGRFVRALLTRSPEDLRATAYACKRLASDLRRAK